MDEINFCYWLKGMMEITNPKTIDYMQTKIIKDHLELVNAGVVDVIEKIKPIKKKTRRSIKVGDRRGNNNGRGIVMC